MTDIREKLAQLSEDGCANIDEFDFAVSIARAATLAMHKTSADIRSEYRLNAMLRRIAALSKEEQTKLLGEVRSSLGL